MFPTTSKSYKQETYLVLGTLSLKEKLLRTRLHKDPALVNKVPCLAEQGGSTLWEACNFGFRKVPSYTKKTKWKHHKLLSEYYGSWGNITQCGHKK